MGEEEAVANIVETGEGRTNYTSMLCEKCIMAEHVYTGVCSSEVYARLELSSGRGRG